MFAICRRQANLVFPPISPVPLLKALYFRGSSIVTRGMSNTLPSSSPVNWTIKKVVTFPDKWPYSPQDFKRGDESSDTEFYSAGRFVTHIDDNAIEKLTEYYTSLIPSSAGWILDLCGSWISHLPNPLPPDTKVLGIGLNEEELERNPAYTEWKVYDLNRSEISEWSWIPSDSIDLVICTVSIDYLVYPVAVLNECRRVLKQDGTLHLAISNRCFPTKAISRWLRLSEQGRLEMVSNFVHFAGFQDIEIVDIVKGGSVGRWEGDWGVNDPLWVVRGRKM